MSLGIQAQVQCEDTCQHVHGIDLSHYQGNVFWEWVHIISIVPVFHNRLSWKTSWHNADLAIRICCR